MSDIEKFAKNIAEFSADYRGSDLDLERPEHVLRWVSQFPDKHHEGMLQELSHVLEKTYISLEKTAFFLKTLLKKGKMVKGAPEEFWQSVHFLDVQQNGASQSEMLALVDSILADNWGIERNAGAEDATTFVYLDDGIFSGGHVSRDLSEWIRTDAPADAEVHVIVIAFHESSYYFRNRIRDTIGQSGKDIRIRWWSLLTLEDRKININDSDVLRPTELPDIHDVHQYAESLGFRPALRKPGGLGKLGVFSSEAGRSLLEQQLLIAGVHIRNECPDLNVYQRPLGNSILATLGFGSTVVTFRNCPNNAPLAFWAGDPWYPLFPRLTNAQTSYLQMKRMLEEIEF